MLKKFIPHIAAIVIFYLVGTIYFFPETQGQKLIQSDMVNANAMNKEVRDYNRENNDRAYWNNGMFGGMPWGMLTYGNKLNATRYLNGKVASLGQSRIPGTLFWGMLSCYIVLILLGVNPWLSIGGAFAFSYNTNYLVLLEAGHMAKVAALMSFPLIFGGSLIAFRKDALKGALLFAIGCSLAIYHNHIQMLYYLALLMVLFYLIYFPIQLSQEKKGLKTLLKPLSFLAIGAILALAAGSAQLYSTNNFGSSTMRGKPILKQSTESQQANSSSDVDGLEWTYVNQWSNDTRDLAAMIIPRFVGGSSAEEVPADSDIGRLMAQNNVRRGSDGTYTGPMYWGNMNLGTSGPSYFGAVLLLLFVFALFQLKPAFRWGILVAVLFGAIISMGKNASWLVRPMYDYLPLFNKFRAHSSLLSIFPALLVIPAFLGLQKAVNQGDKEYTIKSLYYSLGIVGGFCLLMGLIGSSLFSFLGPNDSSYPDAIKSILIEQRQSFLRNDAFRSFFLVLLSSGILWAFFTNRIKNVAVALGGVGLLMILDLYLVNQRYLDADNFESKNTYEAQFAPRPVDQQIMSQEPNGRGYYRVLDLSINTFNSAMGSIHHNTIGGYYAAKLQRYADLIDYHISRNNMQVLNMLNAKYFITPPQQGGAGPQVQVNPGALGNAWFVDSLVYVSSPKEEINALNNINTANAAVVLQSEFSEALAGFSPGSGVGQIELTNYAPHHLVYNSNSNEEQLAVFSEIWYGPDKGWSASIDGEAVEMIRVNYALRALLVPAGNHEIVFQFKPKLPGSLRILSILASWILFLGFIGYFGYSLYNWSQQPVETAPVAPVKKKATTKASKKTASTKKTKKTSTSTKKKKK